MLRFIFVYALNEENLRKSIQGFRTLFTSEDASPVNLGGYVQPTVFGPGPEQKVILFYGQWTGDVSEGQSYINDVVKDVMPEPVREIVTEASFYDTQRGIFQYFGGRFSGPSISRFTFEPYSDEWVEKVVALMLRMANVEIVEHNITCLFALEAMNGVIQDSDPHGKTSFPARRAVTNNLFTPFTLEETGEGHAKAYEIGREVEAELFVGLSNSMYVNYMNDINTDWELLYYGGRASRLFRRLRRVKRRFDKHNLFRFEQSIPPRKW
jgi:hypothetical protein